jgi:hypothetical protein
VARVAAVPVALLLLLLLASGGRRLLLLLLLLLRGGCGWTLGVGIRVTAGLGAAADATAALRIPTQC